MKIGDAFPSSGAALKDLRRIELDEMLCHQQHKGESPPWGQRGRYCRADPRPLPPFPSHNRAEERPRYCYVSLSKTIECIDSCAVEDPNGQAITLAVENICEREAFHYPVTYFADLFPVGAMLAIKEPSVCLGRTTGIAEVRVSVPTDIERIPSNDLMWRFDSPVGAMRLLETH